MFAVNRPREGRGRGLARGLDGDLAGGGKNGDLVDSGALA
jgi:hypothetical protein